jgi:hypothetical protein
VRFARIVFVVAGVLGLLLLLPLAYSAVVDGQGILPGLGGAGMFFLGFVAQYMCWQILYLVLATNPVRYRPMMIPAFFAQAMGALYPQWLYLYGFEPWVPVAAVEIALAILFLVAYWTTGQPRAPVNRSGT